MTCPIQHPTCHRETEKKCPTRNALGLAECWLGNEPIAYTLRAKPSGNLEITLSQTHRKFLVFLSATGGEVDYDYRKLEPETAIHMRALVEMRMVSSVPYIGHADQLVRLRLTDMGRNVVDQIKKLDPSLTTEVLADVAKANRS